MSSYRSTGRTFRRVLNALYLASSGDKVLYVVSNQRNITQVREYAREFTDHLGGMDYKKSHSIVFPNGGLVEFATAKSLSPKSLRGKDISKYKQVVDLDGE